MHNLTQTRPHDSMPSFQIGQAALKTGLTSTEFSQPPVTKHDSANSFSRLAFTPSLFHPRRYLCTELAPRNSSLGKAFRCQHVPTMCMIAATPFSGSMGFCSTPGCCKYFRLLSSLGLVLSGSARTKNSSEVVNDLVVFMGIQISKIRHDGMPLLMEKA